MNKENAKEEIKHLVEKYNRLVEAGKVKSYNEEMTKKDFILPLFRALGWSVEDGEEVTAEEKPQTTLTGEELEENDFWEEGSFIESCSPEDFEKKKRTFHMKHDEEMNYNCK
ncbi:MAG: type I restriction endonuclease [Nanoarchaeota archaeon]